MEINVFLVGGQSNCNGKVPTTSPKCPDYLKDNLIDGVKVFDGTGLQNYSLLGTAAGQNGNGRNWVINAAGNRYSFAHVFLKLVGGVVPDIVACQATQGGSTLHAESSIYGSWSPDFTNIPTGTVKLLLALEARFNGLKAYCLANCITMNVRGVIWHHGEANMLSPGAEAYYGNFGGLIDYTRLFTGVPDLPFFCGTVPDTSLNYSTVVKDATLQVAAEKVNVKCRLNNGFKFIDGVHFDAPSCNTFGQWGATQFLTNYV